jgi:hypothetical protein
MDSNPGRDVWEKTRKHLRRDPCVLIPGSAENTAGNSYKRSYHFAISGIFFSVIFREKGPEARDARFREKVKPALDKPRLAGPHNSAAWMLFLHQPEGSRQIFGPFKSKEDAFAQCDSMLDGGSDDPRRLRLFPPTPDSPCAEQLPARSIKLASRTGTKRRKQQP